MSPTLMRVSCYECDYAAITLNEHPPITGHGLLLAHFAESGHYLMRPVTPDDLMQDYFIIPEQPVRYSDLGAEK